MKNKLLCALWGFLYIVCYALGHAGQEEVSQTAGLTAMGILFFLPPTWLLVDAIRVGNRKTVLALRWIAIGSLFLTVTAFLGNLAAVTASDAVGVFLHEILLLVSVPLGCMQFSLVSLFLWACLLFGSFYKKK